MHVKKETTEFLETLSVGKLMISTIEDGNSVTQLLHFWAKSQSRRCFIAGPSWTTL